MITVPMGFARGFSSRGELAWIAELPELVERYLQRWHLDRDGKLMHGRVGLIVPVRTADATPAVLKLSWPHEEALDEAVALDVWNGLGAVRLLDHDAEQYLLLLERLDPARSLNTEPIEKAVTVAGGLLRRLAVAAPPLHRSLSEIAVRWQQEFVADIDVHVGDALLDLVELVLDGLLDLACAVDEALHLGEAPLVRILGHQTFTS